MEAPPAQASPQPKKGAASDIYPPAAVRSMAELNPEPLTRAERLAAVLVVALGQTGGHYSSPPYVDDQLGLDYVTLDGKFDLVKLAGMILEATQVGSPVAWYCPRNRDPGQSVTFDPAVRARWPHFHPIALFALKDAPK